MTQMPKNWLILTDLDLRVRVDIKCGNQKLPKRKSTEERDKEKTSTCISSMSKKDQFC